MRTVPFRLITSILMLTTVGAAPVTKPAIDPAAMSIVDFRPVEVLGYLRPIVDASFNGRALPMMVHSNAAFTVQLRHDQAARFEVRDIRRVAGSYGIERAGKLSSLAPARGIIDRVTVGQSTDRNVPVSVFEVPQDGYGMLGVGWIRRNRVIVDYASRRLTVSPTPLHSAGLRARLERRGYHAIPMSFDDELGVFLVSATIGGSTRRMVVATASSTDIDPLFARQAGVSQGARFAVGSGPTGAETPRYRLGTAIAIKLRRWTSRPVTEAEIVDNYAYGGQPRPTDGTEIVGGTLGSPFLMQSGAVVDFGRAVLYVK